MPAAEITYLRSLPATELRRRLRVLSAEALADDQLADLPGMPGAYEFGIECVLFAPRHPFLAGTDYVLVRPDGQVWKIRRRLAGTGRSRVLGIYPTARELPLNALRLYIHFSSPMSEGWASRAVRMRDSDGEVLAGALLETHQELWDPHRRRLTVLFEPGRIKRGLAPNTEAGYPLRAGQTVSASVDVSFRDASGRELRSGHERSYLVGPSVRERIDPNSWRWRWPHGGSRQPLAVGFDRTLDHALLRRYLHVSGPAGDLEGRIEIGPDERSWRFVPNLVWQPGPHFLEIDPRLEDVAGNSVFRVFDRDLTRRTDDPGEGKQISLAFTPSPRNSDRR